MSQPHPNPTPTFRVYFALQQAILLAQSQVIRAQIFKRFSFPTELRLKGSFSQFIDLISQLIQLSLNSYPLNSAQKLTFVTADCVSQQLTIRVTDGGSGLRYHTGTVFSDKVSRYGSPTSHDILAKTESRIRTEFHGHFFIKSFPQRGTQVILQLPVPTDTHIPDMS